MAIRHIVALVSAVVMAASVHAAKLTVGMDEASRGVVGYITSPTYRVPGLLYEFSPNGSGYKVTRAGTLSMLPPPVTGGYAPLRSLSDYGLTRSASKYAVIDVPARVVAPNKSTLPVSIVEPLGRNTLVRTAAKALPIIGNALTIADLINEFERQSVQIVPVTESPTGLARLQKSGYWDILHWSELGLYPSAEAACQAALANFPILFGSDFWGGTGQVIRVDASGDRAWCDIRTRVGREWGVSCWARPGYRCSQAPSQVTRVPLSPSEAENAVARLPDRVLDQLVDRVFSSNDSAVIDVIAREIKDDEDDEFLRFPTGTREVVYGQRLLSRSDDGVSVTRNEVAVISGDTIQFTTRDIVRDEKTGTTKTITDDPAYGNPPSQNNLPGSGSDPATDEKNVTCGLPDTPPCKIDETGTPVVDDDDGSDDFFSLLPTCLRDDWKKCIPEFPDINWTFQLPTGCAPIPLPAFERWGLGAIDICPYQPMIHDIMSMIWAAVGVFGAVAIVGGGSRSNGG